MADKTLTLSTSSFARPKLKLPDIDENTYDLRHRRELSTGDLRRQRALQQRIKALQGEDGKLDVTAMSDDEFDALLDLQYEALSALAVDMPEDVVRQIPVGMIPEILDFYNGYFEKATAEKSDAAAGPTDS